MAAGKRLELRVGEAIPDASVTLHNGTGQRVTKMTCHVRWGPPVTEPGGCGHVGLSMLPPALLVNASAVLLCSQLATPMACAGGLLPLPRRVKAYMPVGLPEHACRSDVQGQKVPLRVQQRLVYLGPSRPSAYGAAGGAGGGGSQGQLAEGGGQVRLGASPDLPAEPGPAAASLHVCVCVAWRQQTASTMYRSTRHFGVGVDGGGR